MNGSLTPVAGSPFAKAGTGLVGGLDFNCDGTLLYAAEGGSTSSLTDAWSVAANGVLTQIAGSPFTAAGSDSNVVFLTPDNTILYQSNQGSKDLNTFTVNSDGTLTSIGTASIAAGHTPAGLASDSSGLFLYGADDAFGLAVFNIVPGVVPTLVGDTAIAGAGQIQGVAAYPPRSCAHTDFSVTQTATPNPVTAGNQLTYTITVTNNGPSAASVAINDLLPRNFVTFVSCSVTPNGVCDKGAGLNRTITFASLASGQSGTATIIASTVSTLLNGDTISNTSLVSNSSAVDTNSANNSASRSVTVSAPLSPTNFIPASSTGNYFGTTSLSTTLKRTLNGTAVAGRTITFSLDGTVVGTALTNAAGVASLPNVSLVLGGIPITAGSHSIGVNFAGDSQYQTSSGTSTLTVNKAVLTVTAQNASKIYGDANPAFTYVISGFLNNETVAVVSGTANCTSSANVGTSAGTAPITCAVGTLLATNYSFTFVPATLTINRAPLVLAGNSVSRLYGDPNPALTGTVTGLKGGDQATATFSTTALSTSPVGTYPITGTVVPGASFLAANYSVTSAGSVTVNPAPLTASAANASRLYGDPNPTFTGTITGVKNGDAITATFASVADPTSPVGTYPITATLNGAPAVISNYTVTTNGGTLTVNPAALSVTAANASRLYGDSNPLLSGTITGIKNADNITATYASPAVATSAVGPYPIVPTLIDPAAKLGNYTVTSHNGTLTVNPAPLSVTAANAIRLYGDPNPLFSGTITGIKNNDAITATYASVADPTSSVGTFAIVATLVDPTSKRTNYSVLAVNGTLTVNPAPLSAVAAAASRVYGDPNPAFSGGVTGLKNGDVITATFASAASATSPVGTYPILATLTDPGLKLGNYTVNPNNGTLTVTQASLTVTAGNASRLYGDPNPPFTGTITGLKNGDNITPTISGADPTTAVGTYPLVPSLVDPGGKLGNYAVTSNNGTLTIGPAALSVIAANAARAYGSPNPAFTGVIAGLKNADAITALFTSVADSNSILGTYPIVPVLNDPSLKLGNYTVTSKSGILIIGPATPVVNLTVQAGPATALLTAQVINAGPIFPTGTVQFSEGTTALGQPVALSQIPAGTPPIASLQVSLTPGTHTISVNYSGDPTYTAAAATPVTVVIGGPPPGLRFVPVTPCRIADTRNPAGPFGGPFITGNTSRGFAVPDSACNIPATAQAYSVNVTVVPKGPLGFLTMFPCGQSVPLASTLNSIDGRVKAAAAIVPAGTNGGVCAFATQDTELILDINGYFVSDLSPSVLEFYPLAPCRLVDTRNAAGSLGGPSLVGTASRTFPILSSPCNIPATAKAYSLNFTSVPKGPLGFLTTWPAGSSQPLVSTLNAITGAVTANAAIVPAGTNGDISVFVTQASDLVIDINGYFAPPDTGGLSFFPLVPCRVLDTRNPAGALPFNGKVDVNVSSSGCTAPASAQSFVLNATVVPPGPLGFLTLWPQGATQPLVSTLNAIDGSITSNMAIVPTTNGSVSAFGSNPAHLILDISGYFAP